MKGNTTTRALLLEREGNIAATQEACETPVSNPDSGHVTCVHVALRDALWHVIHVGRWRAPLAKNVQWKVTRGWLELRAPSKASSPGGGGYVN